MNINEKSLQAFRRLAAGVSVISAGNQQERYAMTASSVSSVSMEPPSLLVCIHNDADIIPFLQQQNIFCVNLLQREDEAISNTCATPGLGEQRFAEGQWQHTTTGLPYLTNTQANIFCDIDKRVSYATHTIYIARITNVICEEQINPLLYLDGQYGEFN